MKKKKVWIWVGVIVVVLAISAVGVTKLLNNGIQQVDGNAEGDSELFVQRVSEKELTENILVTGKVIPENEQKVFLEPEKGEVSEYFVKENSKVKKGDPLFTYDKSKLEADFTRAVRDRDLIKKQSEVEISRMYEMDKKITEGKNKVGVKTVDEETGEELPVFTKEELNELVAEKVQMEMDYETTKASITTAQEEINELDKQMKDMTVVSKIDGIVVKVEKNIANTETTAAEEVVHIVSNKPFKVVGTMTEFDTVKMEEGQAVIIRPKVYKDQEWNGVVETISQFPEGGSSDEFGGYEGGGNVTMYPFKVKITDDTTELRQGFHVSLEIKTGDGEKVLSIPHMAIWDDEEGAQIVYVVNDENILERREIEIGNMNDEFVEITSGVAADELVVIMPDETMYDGMEVISFVEAE